MKTQTLQRVIAVGWVWAVSQMFFPPAMQAQQDGSKPGAPVLTLAAGPINVEVPCNKTAPPKLEIALTRPVDRVPAVDLKKFGPDKMTSFFVRATVIFIAWPDLPRRK